jgi:hypothetical protein
MKYADRDAPVGKIWKWHEGGYNQPGLGGQVTPFIKTEINWHEPDARSSVGMSIFVIFSIASMTAFDFFGSGSPSISPSTVGFTCHERPYLSLSHPHWLGWPPAVSFRQ